MQTCLGETASTDRFQTPKSPHMVINEGGKNGSEDTNQDSLVLLLIWKTQDGSEPRIAFYSGGDAEWEVEEKVAKWVTPLTIDVLKTSHHGSRKGTSRDFIKEIQPRDILLSAGSMHNHPYPEWILFLDMFYSQGQLPIRQPMRQCIHSVCFPYTLGYVNDPAYFNGQRYFVSQQSLKSNINEFIAPTEPLMQDFINELSQNWQYSIKELQGNFVVANKWFDDTNTEDCSYFKAKERAAENVAAAELAYDAAPKGQKTMYKNAWDKQKAIKDMIDDRTKAEIIFGVACISSVVARCWAGLSNVDSRYFLVAGDRDGEAMQVLIVRYTSLNLIICRDALINPSDGLSARSVSGNRSGDNGHKDARGSESSTSWQSADPDPKKKGRRRSPKERTACFDDSKGI